MIEANNANVAISNEPWLDGNIPSSAIGLGSTLNIFGKDRTTSQGSGLLAYAHASERCYGCFIRQAYGHR